jgi:hypothetical protein
VNGPVYVYLEKNEEVIRQELAATKEGVDPSDAEMRKEARKRFNALPTKDRKEFEQMFKEREAKRASEKPNGVVGKKKAAVVPGKKKADK